ncbi:non-specific lipid transfer protein GPI-anchored 11-like [Trifolium pratense]|uniref:Uncharacterized protein n=1 Tax=Trifolium pratense TaxID=57577 RepID=A0ACB0LBA7_TRIPR|nr:non-specific lipid transfer protein GPI-anchored 11-like [Trifolium pratense]CAJ2664622.1 unnamed protein product [Trifolium pratense]
MAKVFILAFLLMLMLSPSNSLSTPNNYCTSIINDMVIECLPYFVDHNSSQSQDSCCYAVAYVVATASSCICDIQMKINSLSLDVSKTMKLPSVCGVSLPCELHVSAALSSVDLRGPYALENSI